MDAQSPGSAVDRTAGAWLEYFPVNFFATVMGLSGMTLATLRLEGAAHLTHAASSTFLAITVGVLAGSLMLYGLKALRYPKAVAADWHHPVKIAFFPAISIGLILTGSAMSVLWPLPAKTVWATGAFLHFVFTLGVVSAWISHRPFESVHLTPAWFIPAVGNVLVPIAGVSFGYVELSWFFFSVGIVFWIVLLTLIFNRLVFHNPIPERLLPTLVILIAPPSVAFIAWMQLSPELDAFGRILYFSAVFFAAVILLQIRKLVRLPFSIAWWAYSFPLAGFTVATFIYVDAAHHTQGGILAGIAAYATLALVIFVLLARTTLAALRGEICRPE
ncbi:SLAC1 anion channel family protein [Stappia sp. F7233]|uniref:SLAC1 anion channel family protein n=1 Tax=Stappia albiluteola TaxID=2758565 RepID=A0A839ACX8_9HYPH|nr:SLAC1 anion channel family protein [Stappia albiluteola]MBA5776717.1 SLAC1 anion channel family protein [Stappia albiluteola]